MEVRALSEPVSAPNVKLTALLVAAIEFGGSILPPDVTSEVKTIIFAQFGKYLKFYVPVWA